jgi:hypothetical protein
VITHIKISMGEEVLGNELQNLPQRGKKAVVGPFVLPHNFMHTTP